MKTDPNKLFPAYCKTNGLPSPIPEFRFAPQRRWRIDWFFEFEGKRVGLEVEGGIWQNGRHTRGSGYVKDLEKYNSMAVQGIYLLRCQPKDLLKLSTLQMVATCLGIEKKF